ncbi:MAG: glycosyltransferase [Chloroflexi bacterium]|nr:glycosyltransferase [Chloroflexota bacterium]
MEGSNMGDKPTISVIIPVLNEADKIERCLEAVLSQSLKPTDVILVDGHSTDGTVERAKRFPVRVFYQEYGAAGAARQIGLENAQGEYLAFTDGDCIPSKDWLRSLLGGFSEGIMGVGGGILNVGKGLWTESINLTQGTFLGGASSIQSRIFKERRFVKSISGCNSLYRRDVLVEAGGFNVNLSGADETELNSRLLKKGKLLYVPEALVAHDHGRGLKEFAKQMYRYGIWRRECRVWDLPVIPPLLAPILLLSLIFTPWVFLSFFGLYVLMALAMGLNFAVQKRDARYLLTIPVVLVVEHFFFIIGFWKETVSPTRMSTREKLQR